MMSRYANGVQPLALILALILSSCNLPSNVAEPEFSADDIANTAVAKALTAQAAAAPSATPEPAAVVPPAAAQCSATVTANTVANVRSGPGTDYDVIGSLPTGGTALVAGTNNAHTWWYIGFAGGPGGYAWIAGSVVTAACLSAVVQVVAAPPLPAAPPPGGPVPTATQKFNLGPLLIPGLEFYLLPSPTPIIDLPDLDFDFDFSFP
ncbi:MAG: SH3 domain-containing protein [Chloroflexota bacterium]